MDLFGIENLVVCGHFAVLAVANPIFDVAFPPPMQPDSIGEVRCANRRIAGSLRAVASRANRREVGLPLLGELSVMGYLEVVPRIPRLLARIRQTASCARALRPDAVVTIDAGQSARGTLF